jgi:hypothetical protein
MLVVPTTQGRNRLALPDVDAVSNHNPKLQKQPLCNEPVARANACGSDVHRAGL